MIVNTETKVSYLGDGITTAFPVPFKFSDAKDVKLILYDAATEKETQIESDYYVDTESSVLYYPGYPPGQEPGEALRPPVAPVGTKLVIYRQTPINQLVDMGEKYPMPIIEAMNDKLTFISQEMKEQLDRSVKVDRGADFTADELIDRIFDAADSAEYAAAETETAKNDTVALKEATEAIRDEAEAYKDAAAGSAEASEASAQAAGVRPLKQSHAYSEGDVAFAAGLPTWAYLAVKTAGVTGPTAPTFTGTEEAGDIITDGTVEWEVKDIKAGDGGLGVWELAGDNAIIPKDLTALTPEDLGTDEATIRSIVESMIPHLPIGMYIKISHNGAVPEGCLECNGASAANAMYPDLDRLWDGKYGRPDPDHFYLPDLRGKFLMGADVAGEVKEAGLPNIEGELNGNYLRSWGNDISANTGALRVKSGGDVTCGVGSAYGFSGMKFDASLSNLIYGASDTVQPPAITCRVCVVAFHATNGSLGLLDTTQIVNEINRKQDRLKDNVDYVVEDYRDLEGNWYRKYKSGWIEQGGRYVAQSAAGGYATVNLIIPMQSSNYAVTSNIDYGSEAYTDGHDNDWVINRKTTTTFMITRPRGSLQISWVVCGQGAEA